jgi:RNA polymerase sigma-70 factor, ECF subfamily
LEPTDEELVDRVIRKQQEGFSLLFERYRATVCSHLNGIVREPATADDLTQEVFLRLWNRADQWNGDGALPAWLLRIATHLALNHLRTVKRRREQPIQPAPVTDTDPADVPAWMVDASTLAPDEATARNEHRQLLHRVVDTLPEDKQVVVRMIYDAHRSTQQVADELGIPEGTVKSRLFHARQQIARSWQEMGIDWEDFA